jgi:mannose PTS system EIIA component
MCINNENEQNKQVVRKDQIPRNSRGFGLFLMMERIIQNVGTRLANISIGEGCKEGVKQMIGVIVGTHGKLSKEILRSTEMIFGHLENVVGVTFEPGESVNGLVEKYKAALETIDWTDGLIFLVDLFGGSPYNAASRIVAGYEKMDIVTGVNLPMIVDLLTNRGLENVENLSDMAIRAGQDSMKSFRVIRDIQTEEEL